MHDESSIPAFSKHLSCLRFQIELHYFLRIALPFTLHNFNPTAIICFVTQRNPRRRQSDPQILLSHENKHVSCLSCDFVKMEPKRLVAVVLYRHKKRRDR